MSAKTPVTLPNLLMVLSKEKPDNLDEPEKPWVETSGEWPDKEDRTQARNSTREPKP